MHEIIDKILICNKNICKNIAKITPSERGFFSQNILGELRNFLEAINMFFYANSQKNNKIEYTYQNITKANSYVKTQANLYVLNKLHQLLQISASHYTLEEENSERLMLKYYEYLLKIKKLLAPFNITILENITDFPLNLDRMLQAFYEKIAQKIEGPQFNKNNEYNERYYIQKIKPFFVNHDVYYEVTFIIANDYASKFDRIIAFTRHDILPNYAVKLNIHKDYIDILNKRMPILIIDDWEVAIRQCEINHFSELLGMQSTISTSQNAYKLIVSFLKSYQTNLLDLILYDNEHFYALKDYIVQNSDNLDFLNFLERCRDLVLNNRNGSNIIRYLLYKLNNRIIKLQKDKNPCNLLSNLFISNKAIPFDNMPFIMSLKGHNPSIYDLLNCIDYSNRKHELFARFIKNNTEQRGELYTDIEKLQNYDNIDELITQYNNHLYTGHKPLRELVKYGKYIYIREYETNVHDIIKKLIEFSKFHIKGYSASMKKWIDEHPNIIDCDEKKHYLTDLFENSAVSCVYGPAGTGKSTLINHISQRFSDYDKIYLANTNPAVDNLQRKITNKKTKFMTIAKFLSQYNNNIECFLLFIDECSTVSNSDMLKILQKADFKLLVLVGDIHQIEAILFGNWFGIAKSTLNRYSICELSKPYRTKDENLLKLWEHVRNTEDDIVEIITKYNYSHKLDESIFTPNYDDEIILCLNYDGLYGINNINRFLQAANPNKEISWGGQIYKVGDPILFNETKRFGSLIYNNMKGKIVSIQKKEDMIYFNIEINKSISSIEAEMNNLEFIDTTDDNNSIVRFHVNKYKNQDEDNDLSAENVVPFQIAYAISIHRAQGLEYNSVKIVITEEVDEMITHNIFYTAITRSRQKLKIYWTPETEKKILTSFKKKEYDRDYHILSSKYNDLK